MRIYVSGVHAGVDPSPGLGVARCIRARFPEIELIALEHAATPTGLHWAGFDKFMIFPGWDQLDLGEHARELAVLLGATGMYIPTMDSEVEWASAHKDRLGRAVVPSLEAVMGSRKPFFEALPVDLFHLPKSVLVESLEDAVAFFRSSNDDCWIKSRYHDAHRVHHVGEIPDFYTDLSAAWGAACIFMQEHVSGAEETLAFSAVDGEILAAAKLTKIQISWQGKVIGGRVEPPSQAESEMLRRFAERTIWSGGCELEYIVDESTDRYLVDLNPRFPAWAYASYLAGLDLVAPLIEAIGCQSPRPMTNPPHSEFVRISMEIPARFDLPPSRHISSGAQSYEMLQHPSDAATLARGLRGGRCG